MHVITMENWRDIFQTLLFNAINLNKNESDKKYLYTFFN